MNARIAMDTMFVERNRSRYIFRRRAFMTVGATTIQVKTVDVSEENFGVVAAEPVKIGQACFIVLNNVVGDCIMQQTFHCETIYCVLAGIDQFRIGLHIQNLSSDLKNQLGKIIANCTPPSI